MPMSCEMSKQQDLYKGIVCICIANEFNSRSTFNIQLLTEHLLCANAGDTTEYMKGNVPAFTDYTSVGKWTVMKKTNKMISDSDVC